jgi:dihydrofolate synthase/folylpolyglutamate synthase
MTYEQALAFWSSRINYEKRVPEPDDLRLDRMRALLDLFDNPHQRLRIVHIAGSKGKGSTAAMLAAVLHHAGYRTGLFTSPHLEHVEERIQVNASPILADDLARHMARIRSACLHLDALAPDTVGVTFFEIITALGFLHFVEQQADITILEVGLGGRLDATNVCDPLLSIITGIGFDHVQQLGSTLARIAFEKAGIIKPFRPVLSGTILPEPRQVIEQIARDRNAPLRLLNRDFHYTYHPGQITAAADHPPRVAIHTTRRTWPLMPLKLLGEHQAANAALVIAAVEELQQQGFLIPDEAVAAGLQEVHWPARFEIVRRRPLVILDCAHNLASTQALLDTLQSTIPLPATNGAPPPRRHLIFACSQDKDIADMLRLLEPHFHHAYLTRYQNSPRYTPPEQLAQILAETGILPHTVCPDATDAWNQALTHAAPNDLICITGSVFLAGEIRPYLTQSSPQEI